MAATYPRGDALNAAERVAHNRSGLWVAIGITLVGLFVFTGIFNILLPGFGDNLNGIALITLGLVFSLAPAALWLYFFYRLDRLEAEPKRLVLSIFVLGALAAAALHDPILEGIFGVRSWQYNTWWGHLFGGILIVGVVEQALIYAVVRYSVFNHPEFDERVDGVIYSVAAGLGLATVLNFQYVLRSGGVDLDIGSIRMVINALAYASLAGIMGYYLGQARFEKTPVYYVPAGLLLASTINGIFFYLLDRTIGAGGLQPNPWSDLFFAAVVAALSLAVVFWLIERANEETLRIAHQQVRAELGMAPPVAQPVPAAATPAATPAAPTAESSPKENAA